MLRWLLSKTKARIGKVKIMKKKPRKKSVNKARKIARPKRRVVKRSKPKATKKSREIRVGSVSHYFPKVKAAVFKVTRTPFKLGSTLSFQGHTTAFKQKVSSMQINHVPIQKARPGQEIGLQVKKRVRVGDRVLLLR